MTTQPGDPVSPVAEAFQPRRHPVQTSDTLTPARAASSPVAEAFQPRRRVRDYGSLKHVLVENQCYHTITTTRDRIPVFRNSAYADVVMAAIREIRVDRAHLLAWAVMPDHIHLVLVPREPYSLPQIMQSLKGYSSWSINRLAGTRGSMWQQGYYDRRIRDERHLFKAIAYVNSNPVLATLASEPGKYPYASYNAEETDLERWYAAEAGKPRLPGSASVAATAPP